MSKDNKQGFEYFSKGALVMLRRRVENDNEHFRRWRRNGEWRLFDAPWEESELEEPPNKERGKMNNASALPRQAIITTIDNKPLGWVNRYGGKDYPLVWFVGISIGEDDYLNRGYGTEALTLWVNYLFANTDYHKLCLETWSFNPRMMHVAKKMGFLYEGCQRHMRLWQGEWLDLIHFGMLREEWANRMHR